MKKQSNVLTLKDIQEALALIRSEDLRTTYTFEWGTVEVDAGGNPLTIRLNKKAANACRAFIDEQSSFQEEALRGVRIDTIFGIPVIVSKLGVQK